MSKKAVSVTLEADNILWLKSQTLARKGRSVSDTLDALVTEARNAGPFAADARSVVGTVDLPPDDQDLAGADQYIRTLFEASARPHAVKEAPAPPYGTSRTRKPRRG